MSRKKSISTVLVAMLMAMTLIGCGKKPKFATGDFVMPLDKSAPQAVMKVVGSDAAHYTVFEHYLVEGRVTQVEGYKTFDRTQFEKTHIKVEHPLVEGSFSPDKYLDANQRPEVIRPKTGEKPQP